MRISKSVLAPTALVSLLAAAWSWHGRADEKPAAKEAPRDAAALVKRGGYLVNEIARCGDCHTPRDARGELDTTRRLQGASMWFTPRVRTREWEDRAPDITMSGRAGRWTEARMVKLLTTGQDSDPPMPAYHMTEDDARAVTAYLRSLPGGKTGGDPERGRERERRRERERGRDRERGGEDR
jgi:mono/diheme cytochrome c family protein